MLGFKCGSIRSALKLAFAALTFICLIQANQANSSPTIQQLLLGEQHLANYHHLLSSDESRTFNANQHDSSSFFDDKSTNQLLHRDNQIDAPKYYDLNGLIYKAGASKKFTLDGANELRPLDGSRALRPKQAGRSMSAADEEEELAIDSLIKGMRKGEGEGRGQMAPPSGVTYESESSSDRRKSIASMMMDKTALDEANDETLQRKSINVDEGSEAISNTASNNADGTSARLRRKGK